MRQWSDATWPGADSSPHSELGRELERSRRYDRAFSLVRVHAKSVAAQSTNGTANHLSDQLNVGLRSLDRAWTLGDDVVYLLPECGREHAEGFATRVASASAYELDVAIAAFPEDGVTGGSLIEQLLGDADALTNGRAVGAVQLNGTHSPQRRGLRRLLPFWPRRRTADGGVIEWTEVSATPGTNNRRNGSAPVTPADKIAQ